MGIGIGMGIGMGIGIGAAAPPWQGLGVQGAPPAAAPPAPLNALRLVSISWRHIEGSCWAAQAWKAAQACVCV